jgi:putative ABC transport system permease protein
VKYLPLVWAGIWRKRGRSILILAQVVIAFALFGVLQGLASAINYAIATTHADRLYVASKLELGSPLPISVAEWVQTVPGVMGVAPRFDFGATYQRPTQGVPICATDVDSYLAIYAEDKVDQKQVRAMRQVQDGVIVGLGTMRRYGWRVGQRVTLQPWPPMKRTDRTNNWTFDIVGTWVNSEQDDGNDVQLLITHYRYVNESLSTGPARDTMQLAAVRIGDPARAIAIEQVIDSHYQNSSNETLTQSERELVQWEVANFGDIDTVAHRIVAAAFFVLLFATGALMMQSIRERTPELAVLKTVGFSDGRVLALILAETLVLCLVGAAIGLWLGAWLLPLASQDILGGVVIPPMVFAIGFACAVGLALAGGATAAGPALRLRVVDALAKR